MTNIIYSFSFVFFATSFFNDVIFNIDSRLYVYITSALLTIPVVYFSKKNLRDGTG